MGGAGAGPRRPAWVLFVGAFAGVVLVTVALLLLLWLLTETVLPLWYGDAFTEFGGRESPCSSCWPSPSSTAGSWRCGPRASSGGTRTISSTGRPPNPGCGFALPPAELFRKAGRTGGAAGAPRQAEGRRGGGPCCGSRSSEGVATLDQASGGTELAPASAGSDRRAGGGPVQLEIDLLNTGDAEADHWRVQFGATYDWLNPPTVVRPDAVSSEGEKPLVRRGGVPLHGAGVPGPRPRHPSAEAPTPGAPKKWEYLESVPTRSTPTGLGRFRAASGSRSPSRCRPRRRRRGPDPLSRRAPPGSRPGPVPRPRAVPSAQRSRTAGSHVPPVRAAWSGRSSGTAPRCSGAAGRSLRGQRPALEVDPVGGRRQAGGETQGGGSRSPGSGRS